MNGYVVLTRRAGSDDPWEVDHSGEPWTRDEAVAEAKAWCSHHDGAYEWAVARLLIDGPATVVRPTDDQGTLL